MLAGADSNGPRGGSQMPDVSELTIGREPPADPFVEPLSFFVSELSGITAQIQELERAHLQRMESAARSAYKNFSRRGSKRRTASDLFWLR